MDKWGVWKQKKLKFIVVKLYNISVKDIVTQNTMTGDNYTYTLYIYNSILKYYYQSNVYNLHVLIDARNKPEMIYKKFVSFSSFHFFFY